MPGYNANGSLRLIWPVLRDPLPRWGCLFFPTSYLKDGVMRFLGKLIIRTPTSTVYVTESWIISKTRTGHWENQGSKIERCS